MCGIFGTLTRAGEIIKDSSQSIVAITHRGPDDKGHWIDEDSGVYLAQTRLSIVDLSPTGHQPMLSASGRFVIVFNGEIYNHLELRKELDKLQVINWRGSSDTETLLAGFDHWGIEKAITSSIGMFAFGVWDKQERKLILGRDRLGEKPLYYGWQSDTFIFGSDLASFRAHPDFRNEIDRDALSIFMRQSYIPAPYSIFKGVKKLTSGTLLEVSEASKYNVPKRYWSLANTIEEGKKNPFQGSPGEAVVQLEALLKDAVGKQMIADVPLGAFLSGGIDSSLIVSIMQSQSSKPVRTFTIGFDDIKYNEAEHAKLVADYLKTDHTALYISPQQALDTVPKLASIYSEPFADSSQIPTFLVSQLARQHVTVALTGDAGDELFCGYRTYPLADKLGKKVLSIPYWLRSALGDILANSSDSTRNSSFSFTDALSYNSFSKNLSRKLAKGGVLINARSKDDFYKRLISKWVNPTQLVLGSSELPTIFTDNHDLLDIGFIEKMMAMDLLSYLPDNNLCKVDRASMAVSLETRVPLLDHRIVELAWTLPIAYKLKDGMSKWPLREILYKYVPRQLIERPKMGFSVPLAAWLRGPLKSWAEDLLNETRLTNEGFLNAKLVRQKWDEHLSGRKDWQHHLWNVLMFQSWFQNHKG
jgi:asparagine synthase (glutamine-hydrolysing)